MAVASFWLPVVLFVGCGLSACSVGAWGTAWFDDSATDFSSVEGVDDKGAAKDAVLVIELDEWVP